MTDAAAQAPRASTASTTAGLGRQLVLAREALGLDVTAAARLSNLSHAVVRGLEAEAWRELGAAVFVRGWLIRYCRVLGVDEAAAAAQLRAALPADPPPLRLRGEAPSTAPRGHRSLRPLAYLFLFALLGYIGWRAYDVLSANLAASGNAGLAQPEGGSGRASLRSEPPATRAEPPAAAPVVPAAPVPIPTTPPVATIVPAAPATDEASAAGPAVSPQASGVSRLVIEAGVESWSEVRDVDGKVLFMGLLRAAGTQQLAGRAPFRLVIGNAQHVKLRLDDVPVDPAVYVPRRGTVARFTLARPAG